MFKFTKVRRLRKWKVNPCENFHECESVCIWKVFEGPEGRVPRVSLAQLQEPLVLQGALRLAALIICTNVFDIIHRIAISERPAYVWDHDKP